MEWVDRSQSQGLDLPRLFSAVAARKAWIIWPTVAAFAGAAAFVTLVKPRYTANAKVLLENGETYYTRPEKAPPDALASYDDAAVLSEVEAAKSPDVEAKALASLKPADVAEFNSSGGLFSFFGPRAGDPQERALDTFNRHVEIYQQAKTRVLMFEFTSQDPARAARAANALAAAYLDSQRAAKDAEAKSASNWLSEQIDTLRAKAAAAEGRVEALRSSSGLVAGANGLAMPAQQMSDISTQIATARAAQAAAAAKAEALRGLVRSGRLDEVASVANDDSMRRYLEERVNLKARLAQEGRTLLPGHPRMKELAGQLSELDSEIREAALKRVRAFGEDARIAATQVASLQQATKNAERTLTASDEDQAKLKSLEVEAKSARDQLESYLTKYREAIARDAANASPADGRIIASAYPPLTASFPKVGATLLLAPLAAFLVSLGLVVASILLRDETAVAARAASRRPLRAPVPPFGVDPARETTAPAPDAVASEPVASKPVAPESVAPKAVVREESASERQAWTATLETFVDRLADTSEGDILPVLVAGEGGSGALSAALTAARRLSHRGACVLVDFGPSPAWLPDLFERGDNGQFAVESPGLSALAEGEADLAAVRRRDISTALDVIPSGAGKIAPEDVASLIEEFAEAYSFIVVHAPDWRDPLAMRAVGEAAAMVIAASAEDISAIEGRVRTALAHEPLAIKAVAIGPSPTPAPELAAA